MSTKSGKTLGDVLGSLDDDEPAAETRFEAPAAKDDNPNPKIVAISVFVLPEDRRRLRQLSLDTGVSVQKLGHQALNMLLEAKGCRL